MSRQPAWFVYPARRSGKAEQMRQLAEDALDAGKRVIALGRDGKPIIPRDWWRRRPPEAE